MASRLPSIIICTLLSSAACAAELGDARVASFLGQPLMADIELTAPDAPATPVQVRLAHPNVYRGANIAMPKVLSTLSMRVIRRDGRQFVRVTSLAPVESGRLHLYLELVDGGASDVRLATLSMAPDPRPAPPPPPPPVPVPAPVPVAAEVPVALPPPPVVRPPPPRPRTAPKPVPKPVPKPEPEPKLAPAPAPKPASKPEPERQAASVAPPLPLAAAAAPAACAPASGVGASTVCAALDYKNAQLREQIGQLESKVKVLQVAMGASPAEVSQPQPAEPAKPRPARRRPAPEPEASALWGWIIGGGALLLALAGAGVVWLRRRKGAGRPRTLPGVPLMARLRQRFGRKKPAPAPVEPKLADAEQ